MRQTIPLRERPIDWILLAFFVVNLGFITYVVDLEQLVIADRARFDYPLWPPPVLVDNGWQILLLVETRPNEQAPPLGEFRQELEMRLKQQRRRELAQRFLADLRARLEYNPQGLEILKTRPVDSITDAEKEVPVAVKDGTKYVKVLRLLKVAARFPPDLDTAMKTYAVKREIEEDLIYQEALGRKLDRKPEVREQLARKRDDLLYQALFKKEVSDSLSVTNGDVFAYWH